MVRSMYYCLSVYVFAPDTALAEPAEFRSMLLLLSSSSSLLQSHSLHGLHSRVKDRELMLVLGLLMLFFRRRKILLDAEYPESPK